MRKRILVLLTAAALAVSSFPIGVFAGTDINTGVIREADDISATVTDEELVGTQSRTDHFAGGYTITGDGAKDILSVAEQQEGRREADFGYSEAWCANFVSDCALIAGQDKAVPADGLCKSLRDNIINAGGRVVSKAKAKAGDIVFYDWVDKNSTADADPVDFYEHVEICYANSNGIVCTIGGNTSGGKVGRHNIRSTTDRILEIVRPNYTNNQSPVATATPRPTATSTPTPPQLPSGDCSATSEDNVKWKVVKGENNKLKLIISGTGRICDSNMDNPLFNRIHKELCGLSGYENEMISEIEIDEGVTGIGDNAFNSWRSNPYEIEQVSLPNSLLEIGNNAFDFCFNLQEIKIPKNVNFIGYGAFSECRSLKEIIIPKGITSISSLAFEGCSSLQEITIPQSVTYIDSGAFEECSSLQEITLPQSVTYIGSSAFEGCSSLQEITIPQNVTYIGERAFLNCDNIQKIVIPNGVTSIEESTFCGCSSIQEIKIPTSVTSIGKDAFMDCSSLQKLTIPDGITSIEESTFSGCSSIQEIKIPTSVTSIGKDAFWECKHLRYINIPNGVTSIGDSAFYMCSNIERINLPVGILSIEPDTFSGCGSLKEIEIPDGVASIGWDAFEDCSGLQKIIIPTSVNDIGSMAFYNCSSLEEIIIPPNITTIGDATFYRCSNLRKITIPEGVSSIGNSAFWHCSNLQEVSIPKNVTSIGAGAFYACSSLQELIIPEGVKSIVMNTWYGCKKLQVIRLPHTIEELVLGYVWDYENGMIYKPIPDSEFARDTLLKDIYYNGTKEEWDNIKKPTNDGFIDETKTTIHFLKAESPTSTLIPTATPTPATVKITGQVCGTGLSLKGKIGANVLLGFTDTKAVEAADPSVVINVDGKETVLKLSEQEHYTSGKKEIYEIQTYVPAKQINEKIDLKLIDKNGNTITLRYGKKNLSSFTFSISEITDTYLSNYEQYGEKTIDLVTAMKNYCGYIQLMTGYKTDTAKITDQLTDISAKDLKPYATVVDKGSKIAKYAGTGLALQSDTTMQIYFKLTDNVDAYTITLDGETVTPEDCGSGLYCVELKSIPAGKLSTASEIVIRKGDETFTIKASALSWAESVLSNSKAQKQTTINMAKMIYRYAQKADNYFAKK